MKTITVFTPAYNRAHTLRRAFASLKGQTCKDFEWLIIDDGSSDGTTELVDELKKEADFPVRYYWKENGGRHTAVNYSYQFLQTKYVVTLDSDDELTPNAIELMIRAWESIPKEKYDHVWCVSGREMDANTLQLVGKPYPNDINEKTGKEQRKILLKYEGEKHCCRRVDIHIKYKFPVYSDTKFVLENTVWEVINREYDQWCVNDIYGLYHTESEDSLGKGKIHTGQRYRTFYHAGIFYTNELLDEFFYNRRVPVYIVNTSRCAMLSHVPYMTVMKELNTWYKKLLVTAGYPISACWILFHLDRLKQSNL